MKPDYFDLRLDEALMLLRNAGHPFSEPPDTNNPRFIQQIIDGLYELSANDALTGLANVRQFRIALDRELDRVRRSGTPMALCLIDVDSFKPINDNYGHLTGDLVLLAVTEGLRSQTRPMDIIARIGGDEFAAILPDCLPEHAQRVAERFRKQIALARVLADGGASISVTASIGVAPVLPWEVCAASRLIARADERLYIAKSQGRNRVAIESVLRDGVTQAERAALFGTDQEDTKEHERRDA